MTTRGWWGADLLDQASDTALWAKVSGEEMTRGRLRDEVGWLADTLERHGIRAGHSVALHGSPSFTQLWAILALWSLGAQVLLFDSRLREPERRSLIELCAPQCYITFGGLYRRTATFVEECEVLVRWLPGGHPARSSHCVVQFSSGTTGRVKAVGRTPESLLAELQRLRGLEEMPQAGERVLLLESVSGSFSLVCGLLHALDVGAGLLFASRNSPGGIRETAAGANVIMGNPRHFEQLSKIGVSTLPDLRMAVSGGEPLSENVYDAFASRFGVRIGQAYGMTETGLIAANLDGTLGPRTVGRPVDGVRTRIVDGVLDVHVPGTPYLYEEGQPWMGGWLSTQDMATWDTDKGGLRLRGRLDSEADPADSDDATRDVDLLEIESALCAHRDVIDAVVLGIDPIEAHVVGSDELDKEELLAWCRRLLGPDRTPATCHILNGLPRTGNGKIVRDRDRLREYHVSK